MSIDSATFVVQRGDAQFSCLGSELGSKLLDDDLLAAQRGDNHGSIIKANIQDTDLFVVTDGDNGHKSVTGAQVKSLFGPQPVVLWRQNMTIYTGKSKYVTGPLSDDNNNAFFFSADKGGLPIPMPVEVGQTIRLEGLLDGADYLYEGKCLATDDAASALGEDGWYLKIDGIDLDTLTNSRNCINDQGVTGGGHVDVIALPMPLTPWEGHDGGIFHIKNVQNGPLEPRGGPFTAWDIDGNNEREIEEVAVGEELVFVTSSNLEELFAANRTQNWEFGEFTDVSKVESMAYMFYQCLAFNSDINNWDTSNVTDMTGLFVVAKAFNSNIGSWDTSNVTIMRSAFEGAEAFNQPIGSWDTSKVTRMDDMFSDAAAFDQDLSGWCVTNIGSMPTNFDSYSGFAGQTAKQPQWGTCP